jgi:hypothetical protein
MTERVLLQRALAYVESSELFNPDPIVAGELAEAIRAHLAQPPAIIQEPVAEVFDTFGNSQDPDKCVAHVWLCRGYTPRIGTKLYANPAQPPAEPVACEYEHAETGKTVVALAGDIPDEPTKWIAVRPLYATPPAQPPAKPLTDEQIGTTWNSIPATTSIKNKILDFARAIERTYGIL